MFEYINIYTLLYVYIVYKFIYIRLVFNKPTATYDAMANITYQTAHIYT